MAYGLIGSEAFSAADKKLKKPPIEEPEIKFRFGNHVRAVPAATFSGIGSRAYDNSFHDILDDQESTVQIRLSLPSKLLRAQR